MREEYLNLVEEEDTQRDKYLIFSLGTEEYGIEIKNVIEIIGMQTITEIPDIPSCVKGIINLRGKIIPVMDIRLRFNKEARDYDDRTCIVVIEIERDSLGLVVDRVIEVAGIAEEGISEPPSVSKSYYNSYIKGIAKLNNSVKLIVDCSKLVDSKDIHIINKSLERGGEANAMV
ncbi:MAG: chemotaxis protein CheW [Bacillota bacterium]|nr:chemotaxis protein CheW [Bacillota bacterium]